MKRLAAIGVMMYLTFGLIGISYAAATVDDSLTVQLAVNGIFSMTLEKNTIDLGTLSAGGSGGDGLTLYCGSNTGYGWAVGIHSTELFNSAFTASIRYENFRYTTYPVADSGGVESVGIFVPPETPLSSVGRLAYEAAPSELTDTDVRVGLYLTVYVPWSQLAGDYSGTVTVTMTTGTVYAPLPPLPPGPIEPPKPGGPGPPPV